MTLTTAVLAYVVLTTGGPTDPELHWNRSNVPYQFNTKGANDLGTEVFPAVDAGFQAWNAASGIDYAYAGCTTKGKGSVVDGGGNADADGDSIVTWVESSWPYPAATIAITWTYFFEDGEIGEADILMNGQDYTWTTASAGGDTDVQSIIAHESGHFLGLGHSDVPSATMFSSVEQGDTSLRSLDADDIAGAQYLYGAGPSGGAVFDGDSTCEGSGSGEGCACSLEGLGQAQENAIGGIVVVAAFGLLGASSLRRTRRSRRLPACFFIVSALLLAVAPATATVMLNRSLEELVSDSTGVVHGDVESVESRTDGRTIWTVQRIRVREVVAGEIQAPSVEVITPGGTLPEGVTGPRGYQGMKAAGVPQFAAGQEVVVFLQRGPHGFAVTAWQQGVLLVDRDEHGGGVIRRALGGVLRVRSAASLDPVLHDPLDGLPLGETLERIRENANQRIP